MGTFEEKVGIDMVNSKKVINTDISNFIYTFRGNQIMIDSDLAILYKVETKVLTQGVKGKK